MRRLALAAVFLVLSGCTRSFYRESADREVYAATGERDKDPRWNLPRISVDPDPRSRFHDPFNPDRPPIPPDDPAAHRYMHFVNGMRGYKRWHRDGDAPWIEDPKWTQALDLDDKGTLLLEPDKAVELGLIHSRQYQTQLENLYLTSLALTLNRFEFDLQWFARNNTFFTHFGRGENETNTLSTNTNIGLTRTFAAGGQLLVDFANSYIWQYKGPNTETVTSNLALTFVQPILRRAGRDFRLEGLTQAERNLLYSVRDFARFRKVFAFNIATQQYLSLLAQEQGLRNQRANLESLDRNYRLHLALRDAGLVSSVKVDQVFQTYQQSQLGLIRSEAALETQLDQFKLSLGLPPSLPVKLDDALLKPFQLNDPAITDLQAAIDNLLAEYRELDQVPTVGKLKDGFQRLLQLLDDARAQHKLIVKETEGWGKAEPFHEDKELVKREKAEQAARAQELEEIAEDLADLADAIQLGVGDLRENTRQETWSTLRKQARALGDLVQQLFVVQTHVRVYLIRLKPLEYTLESAIEYARANRLDLMNERAQVVDAWRQITVTANALEAGLDVVVNANIVTLPDGGRPFDFRAAASSYSVGLRFDGPLNRLAERNAYRASQIGYQRARRTFMALDDDIVRAIRLDFRSLRAARLSFEIARRSLISAAGEVESARLELLATVNPDPTSTLNTLNALNNVLSAKNALIGSWVEYEQQRIQLLLDIEALQVNERGTYSDEYNDRADPTTASAGRRTDPPPAPGDRSERQNSSRAGSDRPATGQTP